MPKDADYCIEARTLWDVMDDLSGNLSGSHYGFHLSLDSGLLPFLDSQLEELDLFPVQVCGGSMTRLGLWSAFPEEFIALVKSYKVSPIVHLPFCLSFYKEPASMSYQVAALRELADYYDEIGVLGHVTVVAHCGYPKSDLVRDKSPSDLQYLEERFIKNVSAAAQFFPRFLLENVPGCRGQSCDYSSASALYDRYFSKGAFDVRRIGICLDTEHEWACGKPVDYDLERRPVYLIHLNSAPPNASFGSFVDLHGYTAIEQSIAGGYGVFPDESVLDRFRFHAGTIPAVFERHVLSVQARDLLFMKARHDRDMETAEFE